MARCLGCHKKVDLAALVAFSCKGCQSKLCSTCKTVHKCGASMEAEEKAKEALKQKLLKDAVKASKVDEI